MLLHLKFHLFIILRVSRCWNPRISSSIVIKHLQVRKIFEIKVPIVIDYKPKKKGTKFLLITAPQQNNVDSYMKKIYDTYSDFVMKNPFHTPEMPIRSDQFDQSLLKFININGTA